MSLALAVKPFADIRPAVRVALQAFAFERSKTADNWCANYAPKCITTSYTLIIPCAQCARLLFSFKRDWHISATSSHSCCQSWSDTVINPYCLRTMLNVVDCVILHDCNSALVLAWVRIGGIKCFCNLDLSAPAMRIFALHTVACQTVKTIRYCRPINRVQRITLVFTPSLAVATGSISSVDSVALQTEYRLVITGSQRSAFLRLN